MMRRGFASQTRAAREEQTAVLSTPHRFVGRRQCCRLVDPMAAERELDVAATTLSNYRNAISKYVLPTHGAQQLYGLDKRAVNDLYRHLLARGGREGRPLSADTCTGH
jgi:hypothetical protein